MLSNEYGIIIETNVVYGRSDGRTKQRTENVQTKREKTFEEPIIQ